MCCFRRSSHNRIIHRYESIYPEQYEYMQQLKQVLETSEQKGHALLEMPTGTGKTVCIFALYLAMKHSYPDLGKLIYCTRTIAELKQCMEELKRVVAFRKSKLEYRYRSILGVCLSSRRNLCIHPKIDCINPDTRVDISSFNSICNCECCIAN
ncbi:uncharacterized protein [Blastocystis hominis]|nr:uncharacterized protein [Blastocystis hominis]CBK20345.2 unnamed protein product [Blastocystis hominis]|eukprot:XP_012894393.1 uncharacterized protein [Blastocystis hominis]